jgi:hypothetical protein
MRNLPDGYYNNCFISGDIMQKIHLQKRSVNIPSNIASTAANFHRANIGMTLPYRHVVRIILFEPVWACGK